MIPLRLLFMQQQSLKREMWNYLIAFTSSIRARTCDICWWFHEGPGAVLLLICGANDPHNDPIHLWFNQQHNQPHEMFLHHLHHHHQEHHCESMRSIWDLETRSSLFKSLQVSDRHVNWCYLMDRWKISSWVNVTHIQLICGHFLFRAVAVNPRILSVVRAVDTLTDPPK